MATQVHYWRCCQCHINWEIGQPCGCAHRRCDTCAEYEGSIPEEINPDGQKEQEEAAQSLGQGDPDGTPNQGLQFWRCCQCSTNCEIGQLCSCGHQRCTSCAEFEDYMPETLNPDKLEDSEGSEEIADGGKHFWRCCQCSLNGEIGRLCGSCGHQHCETCAECWEPAL
jgi:hypothetical protein